MRLDPVVLDRLRTAPVAALRGVRASAAVLVTLPQALEVPEVADALARVLDDATGTELVALDRASRTASVLDG